MEVTLADPDATERLGAALGSLLFPGSVVALDGELGAGKTHLVRGICAGLGVANLAVVNSPTFVLIQEYCGRLPVFHFDAYRLTSPREFAELGVEEYFSAAGVCCIEWASRVAEFLPADRLSVRLEHAGSGRVARLSAPAGRHAGLLFLPARLTATLPPPLPPSQG